MNTRPAILFWSSGKDAAMALHEVRQAGAFEVVALITTCREGGRRVVSHGTRREVVAAQAAALGLPLIRVELPDPCPNGIYEERIRAATEGLAARDWIFGDIFLADVRAYREVQAARAGATPHFPLWGRATATLAREMLAAGIAAHVVAIDGDRLPPDLAGAAFDAKFLNALPDGIDPCGERGEFHTVVTDSPDFATPLHLVRGETNSDGRFIQTDFALVKG